MPRVEPGAPEPVCTNTTSVLCRPLTPSYLASDTLTQVFHLKDGASEIFSTISCCGRDSNPPQHSFSDLKPTEPPRRGRGKFIESLKSESRQTTLRETFLQYQLATSQYWMGSINLRPSTFGCIKFGYCMICYCFLGQFCISSGGMT